MTNRTSPPLATFRLGGRAAVRKARLKALPSWLPHTSASSGEMLRVYCVAGAKSPVRFRLRSASFQEARRLGTDGAMLTHFRKSWPWIEVENCKLTPWDVLIVPPGLGCEPITARFGTVCSTLLKAASMGVPPIPRAELFRCTRYEVARASRFPGRKVYSVPWGFQDDTPGTGPVGPVRLKPASTLWRSIGWLKLNTSGVSSRMGPSPAIGCRETTRGAAVLKAHCVAPWNGPPPALCRLGSSRTV